MFRFSLLVATAALILAVVVSTHAASADPITYDADVDHDGRVSILDLAFVISNVDSRSDVNGDGHVDIIDIAIVVSQFGISVKPSATPVADPTLEPTSSPPTPTKTPTPAAAPSPTFTSTPGGPGVIIRPGDDVQAIVDAHPAGTTFRFTAGVFRTTVIANDMIRPKTGDTFIGDPGAVINGAKVLSSWLPDGAGWRADGQTQEQGQVLNPQFCDETGPGGARSYGCAYAEDVFINDVPLRHIGSIGEVAPGTWYFDYAAGKIYIGDNPAGKKVEVSQGTTAFSSNGNAIDNVTIRGLTIEKFANPAQKGAIDNDTLIGAVKAKNWLVEGNDVRLNHGVGVSVSDRGIVRNNNIHMNGQMGLGGTQISQALVEGNEIAYNNFAGFSSGWEAGGFKFIANVSNVTIRNNHSHHNNGAGMWTDSVNDGTLYENNVVEWNTSMGIEHEISGSAIIRNNTVRYNSTPGDDAWIFGAQIMVQNSHDVEVYGNRVAVRSEAGDGIAVVQQPRYSDGTTGTPRPGINNSVHDNEIWYLGAIGLTGIVSDSPAGTPPPLDRNSAFTTNHFDHNTYHAPNLATSHWATLDSGMSWAEFRAAGQEPNGGANTDLSSPP